jgi:hypothetical protein
MAWYGTILLAKPVTGRPGVREAFGSRLGMPSRGCGSRHGLRLDDLGDGWQRVDVTPAYARSTATA